MLFISYEVTAIVQVSNYSEIVQGKKWLKLTILHESVNFTKLVHSKLIPFVELVRKLNI